MTREWKPGDVAMVTIGGVEQVAHRSKDGSGWITEPARSTRRASNPRPLVVIDPEDREQVERLTASFHQIKSDRGHESTWWTDLQAALREFANPTPPKPDEPTGLGAVVEDSKGRQWVRVYGGKPHSAVSDDEGPWKLAYLVTTRKLWTNLDAVRVLSEGVPS